MTTLAQPTPAPGVRTFPEQTARDRVRRLAAALRARAERRRQMVALGDLDNHLRDDIGLPPLERSMSFRLQNNAFGMF